MPPETQIVHTPHLPDPTPEKMVEVLDRAYTITDAHELLVLCYAAKAALVEALARTKPDGATASASAPASMPPDIFERVDRQRARMERLKHVLWMVVKQQGGEVTLPNVSFDIHPFATCSLLEGINDDGTAIMLRANEKSLTPDDAPA